MSPDVWKLNEIQISVSSSKVLLAHCHLIYLHVACGFCTTMAELNSCNRDHEQLSDPKSLPKPALY